MVMVVHKWWWLVVGDGGTQVVVVGDGGTQVVVLGAWWLVSVVTSGGGW